MALRSDLHRVTAAYTQRFAEAGSSPAEHSLTTSELDGGNGRMLGIFPVVALISGYFTTDAVPAEWNHRRSVIQPSQLLVWCCSQDASHLGGSDGC